MKRIEIRLRVIDGCLVADQALTNIYRAAEELGLQAIVWVHIVRSQEEAEEMGFPGSPTIMVKWKDVNPDSAGESCYGSRLYMQDGYIIGMPTMEMLKGALAKSA